MNGSSSPQNIPENYYVSNDSSTTISHKRERSLPIGNNYGISTAANATFPQDDVQIYANLSEIQQKQQADFIDRQEKPPIPSLSDEPIRVLRNSGWTEFKSIGGRFVLFCFCKH